MGQQPEYPHMLRDDQWEKIKDLLPGREGHVGVTAKDNRLFINACLYMNRTGAPWRYLPKEFGNWKSVFNRFNNWSKWGVWERIFEALADANREWLMIDGTRIRAHSHAAGARGGRQARLWAAVPVDFRAT